MIDNPFDYFTDEVIAKLYPQWAYTGVTLDQFKEDCRAGKWDLYSTCLSYNPPEPKVESCSFFGDPIDPNKEYLYRQYELICPYTRIGCIVYHITNKYFYDPDFVDRAVAVCFYDC